MTGYIEPAPHEFSANFLFDEHGLTPYFAADSEVKAGGGSQQGEFTHQGEQWTVKLYYQDSNILHPGNRLPTGTSWRLDEMREFRLSVSRYGDEDPVGEQGFSAHIAPRWHGMEVEYSDGTISELSVPDGIHEAVIHGEGEYVDGDAHVNTCESHASLVRRWLSPHRGISKDKLTAYLRAFQLRQRILRKPGRKAFEAIVRTVL